MVSPYRERTVQQETFPLKSGVRALSKRYYANSSVGDIQCTEHVCSTAPTTIIILPTIIDILRPYRSLTQGTIGIIESAPSEYIEFMSPKIAPRG